MASAQVLPNSASAKKQEHLEAGKRRLEEFRKKKAAERAKKVASASHFGTDNVDRHDKQPLDTQHVRLTDSNGVGTSDGVREAVVERSRGVNDSNVVEVVQMNELGSSEGHAIPPLTTNYYNAFSKESVQEPARNKEFDSHISQSTGTVNVTYHPYTQEKNDKYGISAGASGRHVYGTTNDQSVDLRPQMIQENDENSGQPGHYGLQEAQSEDNDSYLNSHTAASLGTSLNSGGIIPPNKPGYASLVGGLRSSYEDYVSSSTKIRESSSEVGQNMHAVPEFSDAMISDIWEKKHSNSTGTFSSENSKPLWLSESQSNAFTFDSGSSSNHAPLFPAVGETNTRRSRPSFLDSINMPRVPLTEPGRGELFSSKLHDMDVVVSSASDKSFTETQTNQYFSKYGAPYEASVALEHSLTPSVSAGTGGDMYRHNVSENCMESKYDSYSQKQDEDFAALEQHIEDLTQEKFSLQRALEASRTLAESLAAENSSLTDSFNQQGSVVNQLKSEMDKLREEIKTQLMELESIKIEYANAQLECNAADERAKLLASEVIGLEEKALRLRSSELKLERQLENSQAEISSFKKKLSGLGKERQDLQSTIDALQEEKKLLQAKLWKASANGTSVGVSKSLTNKKDVSTSTEDLVHEDDTDAEMDTPNLEAHSADPLLGSDASSTSFLPENRQFNVEVSSSNIPPDQIRMVQNVHTLISELALEKEELMQAVLAESSESSKLKELNKELSRKLEAQTQRLELLTAQSMANENIPTRPADPRIMPDSTPYADEGDEVVERVLGWIMKLFPGGPSRRRTSKLL